jgi:pimeloyl-ACP methyl ester carboxylesterase
MEQKHFLGFAAGGFHTVAYTERGDPKDPRPVICVHGLTRNGRDFDVLAAALAARGRRVICPDVVGRGRSQWVADAAIYGYPQYCADMAALIARLGVEDVDWIGTSMGGLIGMFLAGAPGTPIRRLVMNDVGPFVPKAFMARLRTYVGQPVRFASVDELETHLRQIHASFGPLSDAQWRHLAEHSAHALRSGDYVLAYDPKIGDAIKAAPEPADIDLWAYWQLVHVPVLVVRGAESDMLGPGIVARMRETHPRQLVDELVVAGAGHAPALMAEEQVAAVADWLGRAQPIPSTG